MAFPLLQEDLNIIAKLSDEPNDVGTDALSAQEFKEHFDKAGNLIKQFINEVFIPYLQGVNAAGAIGITEISGLTDAENVQEALEILKTQLDNTATGSIPDRSLTAIKIQTGTITANELADNSITTDKIVDGVISDEKISSKKLSGTVLKDKTVVTANIADKAVTVAQLADSAVETAKIKAAAVTATKIASDAVQSSQIKASAVTRAKLADDALYSPKSAITENYTIVASDASKTLAAFGQTTTDIAFSLSQAISSQMPNDAEIAIMWLRAKSVKINTSGLRLAISGDSTWRSGTVTIDIPEPYYMVALKKLFPDNVNGDLWTVQGNVEVVE